MKNHKIKKNKIYICGIWHSDLNDHRRFQDHRTG